MAEKVFTLAEVQQHNTANSAWLVIDGDVYDVTKFIKFHPGGASLLASYAGTDSTEDFFDMHRTEVLLKYKRLKIGRLDTAAPDRVRAVDELIPGTLSNVPYAEHNSLQGWHSPFMNEDHKNFRIACRRWYDENVREVAVTYGKANKLPTKALYQKMGKEGLLAAHLAPSPVVAAAAKKAGISLPGNLPWEKFDLHMEQIVHEENARVGVPGFVDGMVGGYSIAAPCIVSYGTDEMKSQLLPELLLGNKRICLAITEPFAGSDVANIKMTAKKTADGKHYVLNGVKKWMTAGMDSDYFVTAVRTGGKGLRGVSLMVVEKQKGLTCKLIKTSYSASAGTAYVTYDNVLVPVKNLLGKENRGFSCIVNNFNHERWMIVVGLVGSSRRVVQDCLLWAKQRKVFGRPLIQQPVIKAKLSEMAAQLESLATWLDLVTYQMQNMDHKAQNKRLGGPIALLKYYATRVTYLIADHSSQVFGGRAITRTGMGQNIERFARAVKYGAIYGGSEEIMVDLAAKQMMKRMPLHARL